MTALSGRSKTSFELLQERIVSIHWEWKVYKQIFSPHLEVDRKDNYDLMNDLAPLIFKLFNNTLRQDIILRICKLADPAEAIKKSVVRPNLSLRKEIDIAQSRLDATKLNQADTLHKELLDICRLVLIPWRHWALAHDDREAAMGAEPMPVVKHEEIDRCIELAVEIVGILDPSPTKPISYMPMDNSDGELLLKILRAAQQHLKQECGEN